MNQRERSTERMDQMRVKMEERVKFICNRQSKKEGGMKEQIILLVYQNGTYTEKIAKIEQ